MLRPQSKVLQSKVGNGATYCSAQNEEKRPPEDTNKAVGEAMCCLLLEGRTLQLTRIKELGKDMALEVDAEATQATGKDQVIGLG